MLLDIPHDLVLIWSKFHFMKPYRKKSYSTISKLTYLRLNYGAYKNPQFLGVYLKKYSKKKIFNLENTFTMISLQRGQGFMF